jgi:hypothetical protein
VDSRHQASDYGSKKSRCQLDYYQAQHDDFLVWPEDSDGHSQIAIAKDRVRDAHCKTQRL